ncbi:bifunctional hydroxymethylpyrimidine kinase/phosphomethylpyrimidine kinase [Desulfovibrio litoralis]|uniref:hydroxymethylpyrimidine kinase n=1 Tax=Desulfovibrio litoralis DSM 11393 TaxID=1121455 RepID=A0A1M7RZC1_9BACT|nr:bifunctional hydroxymethylpyrimidine kinase/phosphomethylpyrimidine kinase [Desulfovibrio litoralis]SHN51541.1 hydroxymethylpyrimidine/phosphomethylpyrimidine kinase [Desulfovibrio litoralis DSM 11393]
MNNHPNVLTIAGSDSGGGAGIQADLKTITCLGAFGVSVITALTAQHGAGVNGIFAPPAKFTSLQLSTIREGFNISAAKTGMLFNSEIIKALSSDLKDKTFPLVVDPVCVSQSGYKLLEDEAIATLKEYLLPLSDLLTPNCPEAECLTGIKINTQEDILKAAQRLNKLGAKNVLIKGGHMETSSKPVANQLKTMPEFLQNALTTTNDYYIDWLYLGETKELIPLPMPKVETKNNHGTGCTLSAAIATKLAFGFELIEAVQEAQAYLYQSLKTSFTPGIGAGPPNFLSLYKKI